MPSSIDLLQNLIGVSEISINRCENIGNGPITTKFSGSIQDIYNKNCIDLNTCDISDSILGCGPPPHRRIYKGRNNDINNNKKSFDEILKNIILDVKQPSSNVKNNTESSTRTVNKQNKTNKNTSKSSSDKGSTGASKENTSKGNVDDSEEKLDEMIRGLQDEIPDKMLDEILNVSSLLDGDINNSPDIDPFDTNVSLDDIFKISDEYIGDDNDDNDDDDDDNINGDNNDDNN